MASSDPRDGKTLVMLEGGGAASEGTATERRIASGPRDVARPRLDTELLPDEGIEPISLRSLVSLYRTDPHPGTAKHDAPRDGGFEARYELLGLLGEGGMGEVRLGRDKVVGRDVAVKRIRAEIEEFARERFLSEARVQGQLEHPSVVPIYDLGLADDGQLYFTMKRLRGETLESLIGKLAFGEASAVARYPVRRLLAAFVQVCLAVEYAHSRGVVHRDLKPANVMLGDFGEVYVLDWGLARILSNQPTSPGLEVTARRQQPTVQGQLLGTPGYLAPEQAAGSVDAVDERSDVYALGVILYELLALEPLHLAGSVPELVAAAFAPPSPPIAERASAARIPPELRATIERATALLPRERHASARELAEAVERYLDGERDELRRRELAAEHRRQARTLATARPLDALREVGRALALDPTDPEGIALVGELLSSLPDEVPPEAEAEVAALERERRRGVLRMARLRAAAMVGVAPLFALPGVTSVWRFGTILGLALANAVLLTVLLRRRVVGPVELRLALASSTVVVASLSMMYGPLILAPIFAVTNAMAFSLGGDRRLRMAAIGASILAVAGPVALAMLGFGPAYYTQHGVDGITVWSPLLRMPLGPTIALVTVAVSLSTLLPSLLIGRLTDRLAQIERRVALQAFHLRQLVPRG